MLLDYGCTNKLVLAKPRRNSPSRSSGASPLVDGSAFADDEAIDAVDVAAAAVAGSGSAVVKLGLSDTAADTDFDEE